MCVVRQEGLGERRGKEHVYGRVGGTIGEWEKIGEGKTGHPYSSRILLCVCVSFVEDPSNPIMNLPTM